MLNSDLKNIETMKNSHRLIVYWKVFPK
jgi:hypothetical protein